MNEIRQGSCLDVLPTLPAESVHLCVTSPPYFALRSYLKPDDPLKPLEIGSEPTPEAWIKTMVAVFREVRRVLHPSGLLFLNLGDTYTDDTKWGGKSGGKNATSAAGGYVRSRRKSDCDPKRGDAADGQPKPRTDQGQLQNLPHRCAEALRADGWVWRQTIVWKKLSPMPESVRGWEWRRHRIKVKAGKTPNRETEFAHGCAGAKHSTSAFENILAEWEPCPGCPKCSPHGGYVLRKGKGRCTTAHEYVFIFSKGPVYFWDSAAFVEEATYANTLVTLGKHSLSVRSASANGKSGTGNAVAGKTLSVGENRNPRSVWTCSPEQMYRLRDDLTPEQRAYVLSRLFPKPSP